MAEDDLPDSFEPGDTLRPGRAEALDLPRGDVRVASWIALLSGIVVVAWYLHVAVLGGVYLSEAVASVAQLVVWALAIAALVCGLICLNARRYREFAAAGFIAGVVSVLVTTTVGLSAALQIIF